MGTENISKRLLLLLDFFSITQRELAQRTGLTETTISRYVNGSRVPNASAIISITNATGVSPTWILGYGLDDQIHQIF